MSWRRVVMVLSAIAAVVALAHTPPGPATNITSSCCPRTLTSEVMRVEWVLGVAQALLTSLVCVVLLEAARRGAVRLSIVLGAAGAIASLLFASDLVFRLGLGAIDLRFNMALVAVAAFVSSVALYLRARPRG